MPRPGNSPTFGRRDGTLEPLRRGEVHVWLARPDLAARSRTFEDLEKILEESERERRDRLGSPERRRDFLVARALLRVTLSRYEPVAPSAWRLRAGRHGRPEVAEPGGSSLRFNLSHTRGRVACAVARRGAVGVDVEAVDRPIRSLALAKRFFAEEESSVLEALPPARRVERFLDYWTLKEAYLKARGLGLAVSPKDLVFRLAPDRPPAVRFAQGLVDEPARWHFELRHLESGHTLALAVQGEPASRPRVEIRETFLLDPSPEDAPGRG